MVAQVQGGRETHADRDARLEEAHLLTALHASGAHVFHYYPQTRTVLMPRASQLHWHCDAEYPNAPFDLCDDFVDPEDAEGFLAAFRAVATGAPYAEALFRLKGREIWNRVHLTPVEHAPDGSPVRCVGISKNISEQALAQREIVRSNQQLAALAHTLKVAADATGSIVFLFDAERQSILVADETAEEWGVSPEQSGVPYQAARSGIVDPGSREAYIAAHEAIMAGEPEARAQVTLVDSRGRAGHYDLTLKAIFDDNGEPTNQAVGIYQDMTAYHERSAHQFAMAQALAEGVSLVVSADLDHNAYQVERVGDGARPALQRLLARERPRGLESFLQGYREECVAPQDRATVAPQLTTQAIRSRLEVDGGFYLQFGVVPDESAQQCIELHICRSEEGPGHSRAFLAFRCVDEQMAKEVERKREVERALAQARDYARRAQENLDIVDSLIRAGIWFMEFDPEGSMTRCVWSNDFRRLLGFSTEEEFPDEFSSWTSRLHPEDYVRTVEHYWACVRGLSNDTDDKFRLRTKDGTYVWYRVRGRVVRRDDGSARLFLGTLVDMTDEIESERVRSALEQAFETAKRANAAKSDFFSRMSHDMRTPLNAIIGMTAIARANLRAGIDATPCLEKIDASGQLLLELVDNVLDMAKIESGRLELVTGPFDLGAVAQATLEMVRPGADARSQHLDLDLSALKHPGVVGDRSRIQEVLINLLSNSVKYTPDGGHVRLSVVEKPRKQPGTACFELIVADDGIGMPADFVKTLFEPFTRMRDSRTETQQGTGLGMSITKNLVELMGGEISVESAPDQGTSVAVTLFLELAEKGATEPPSHGGLSLEEYGEHDFQGARALLVEDNAMNAEIAREFLEMTHIQVDRAVNGREALELLEEGAPGTYDIVFMDIQMPVMGGYEATRAIRSSGRADLRSVPIVAMSADAFAEDVRRSLDAGMNDHIAKPIDLGRLAAVLQEHLGGSHIAE